MYKILAFSILLSSAVFAQETNPKKAEPVTVEKQNAQARLAPNSRWEPRYLRYKSLQLTWQYRRGGLSQEAQDQLYQDYRLAYREWFEWKYPNVPFRY